MCDYSGRKYDWLEPLRQSTREAKAKVEELHQEVEELREKRKRLELISSNNQKYLKYLRQKVQELNMKNK